MGGLIHSMWRYGKQPSRSTAKTIVNVHDPIVGVPTACPQMIATLDTCRDMLEHWAEDQASPIRYRARWSSQCSERSWPCTVATRLSIERRFQGLTNRGGCP
jgi:hypothetical protein